MLICWPPPPELSVTDVGVEVREKSGVGVATWAWEPPPQEMIVKHRRVKHRRVKHPTGQSAWQALGRTDCGMGGGSICMGDSRPGERSLWP